MNIKLSQSQINEIINEYNNGESANELAKRYPICAATVLNYLKRNNITPRNEIKLTKQDINKIIELYQGGLSSSMIAQNLNITSTTVLKWLIKNNISRRSRYSYKRKYQRKYSVNENYFKEVGTPIKAYWLGFLMADGCVLHRGSISHGVKIKLKEADIDILTAFKADICSEHPIKTFIENGYPQASIQINSKHMAYDLINYGCVPAKSLILKFPSNLDRVLHSHFIRGYSDGDGSVMVNRSNNQIYWEVAGTLPFLTEIQRIMMDSCNLKKINIRKQKNICCLRYGGNKQIKKIRAYLYENADRFMERKFMKFNTFN